MASKSTRQNGKPRESRGDDPHFRDPLFRKQQPLEALKEGAHLLLTYVIGGDGPMGDAIHYDDDDTPNAESRGHIEDSAMYVRIAHELLQMAMTLTFGEKS